MPKQKHQNVLFPVRTIFVFLTVAGLLLSSAWFAVWMPAGGVSAATNETINFQARLQTAAGSLVPDGHYNVEFKLYDAESSSGSSQGDCSGDSSCLWVETRAGSNQVRVANGYLTVNLGSVNDFGTDINWDQQLWLTMNVGGTDTTPVWDGEMEPRLMLTAVPYAFLSRGLAIHSGGLSSTLSWETQTAANDILLPDESGIVCLRASEECGFVTDALAFIQGGNEFGATAVLGTNDNHALNLRTNGATRLTIANDGSAVTLSNNTNLILQGSSAYISNTQGQSGSEAFGLNASVTGTNAVAMGNAAQAAGSGVAIGQNAVTTGGIAIGQGSDVTGFGRGVAIGHQASATSWGIAIGDGTTTTGNWAVAIGDNATAAQSGVAIGADTAASTNAIAIGDTATTGGNNRIVIGTQATATADGQFVVGSSALEITQAFIGNGVTNATPTGITLNATGGSGTNIQGGSLSLAGGRGTGNAAGGDINFQVSAPGSSGGSLNSLSTVATFSGTDGSFTLQNVADSVGAFRVWNAAGTTTALNVDTENTRVGIGTDTPERVLDVTVDDNVTDTGVFRLLQQGTGHSSMEFSLESINNSFYVGQSANQSGAFVINSSTAASGGISTTGSPEVVTSSAQSSSSSVNIPSGTTFVVLTVAGYMDEDDHFDGTVSLGGTAMTIGPRADASGLDNAAAMFHLADPSTGPQTLSWSWDNAPDEGIIFTIRYLSGVDATDPFRDTGSEQAWPSSTASTGVMTAQPGDYAIAGMVGFDNPGTSYDVTWSGATEISETFFNSNMGAMAEAFPSGNITITTDTRTNGAIVGAVLRPDAGGGSVTNTFSNAIFTLSQTGALTLQNSTDSTTAFRVLNSSDMPLFQVDTSNNRVYVGTPGGDTAGALMVLGNKTTSGDPTGVNGAMYYNEDLGKFRCFEDGAWKDCVGDGDLISSAFVQGGNSFGQTAVLGTNDNNSIQIKTFDTVRATFDTNNTLYLGNGVTASAPNDFVISGTGSSATGVAGGSITLQGGDATAGDANGGDLLLYGGAGSGAGANGLVVIGTPSFTTSVTQECDGSSNPCVIDQNSVDGSGVISLLVTAPDVTVQLPDPTNTTAGRLIYLTAADSSVDFVVALNGGGAGNEVAMRQNTSATMVWNGISWTAAGASSSTTLQAAYNNTLTSAGGADIVLNNTPTSRGLTIRNNPNNPLIGEGLFEVQTSIGTNLFSVNNNINELVANGGAENSSTFETYWTALGTSTITRTTESGEFATGVAAVSVEAGTTAGNGVRNHLGDDPDTETTYMVSFAVKLASGSPAFSDMRVDYTPDGSSTGVECISGVEAVESSWTRVTCEVQTPATVVTDPTILIYQESAPGSARTFYIDNLSMTLGESEGGIPNNVQIGGGILGGAPTLFTLDRSSAPPVSGGNDAYLGSMYYDTVSGRIQCYEVNGWGSCGSAPDSIITLTPEYSGAVLNGTGIGTLSADFCANESGVLTVNIDFCASGESRNYYKWTSPQASEQTYSIYVSYKLPETFEAFASSNTIQLTAMTDNIDNGTVDYEVFRSTGSAVSSCGNQTTVTTPSADVWYQVPFDGDETMCGFTGGDYIIFKINVRAHNNANVYVENLDFTFTNN